MDVALAMDPSIGLSHFFNSLWHGLEPSASHHDPEDPPLHDVVAARLCPSSTTPTPLTMAMNAVPPLRGHGLFLPLVSVAAQAYSTFQQRLSSS